MTNCLYLFDSRFLPHWLPLMPLRGTPSFPVIPFTKLTDLAFCPFIYIHPLVPSSYILLYPVNYMSPTFLIIPYVN
ncbi:hypothetical protein MKW94_020987 [Papaver nudicaule]|uniref:Uncharacterized protein n=1 Tax=Papaver nudicaule TaxID=74823 RepID=A0AA41V1W2_PAPNU|nr:hypothetical protein [Papaver nudicaule]